MERGLELGPEHEQSFHLNTKGCCFICLKPIPKIEEGLSTPTSSVFSLQNLCRHLKLNVWNALNGSGMPSTVIPPVEKSDLISVSLCDRCRGTASQFSDLLQELESIKKRMERCLGVIGKCLNETDKDVHLVDQFQQIMGGNVDSKQCLGTVWELRREVAVKCSDAASSNPDPEPKVRTKRPRKRKLSSDSRTASGFKCNFCGDTFDSIGAVNTHFTETHLLEVKARASAANQLYDTSSYSLFPAKSVTPTQAIPGYEAQAHKVIDHHEPEVETEETACVKIEMISSEDQYWAPVSTDPLSEDANNPSTSVESPDGPLLTPEEYRDPDADPLADEEVAPDVKIKPVALQPGPGQQQVPSGPFQITATSSTSSSVASVTSKNFTRIMDIAKPKLNPISGKLKCLICKREYATPLYFESHYRKWHLNGETT